MEGYAELRGEGRATVRIPRFVDVDALEQGRRVADWLSWETSALRTMREGGCGCAECETSSFAGRLSR